MTCPSPTDEYQRYVRLLDQHTAALARIQTALQYHANRYRETGSEKAGNLMMELCQHAESEMAYGTYLRAECHALHDRMKRCAVHLRFLKVGKMSGLFWFRLFGHGIVVRNMQQHPLTVAQLPEHRLSLGNWMIFLV